MGIANRGKTVAFFNLLLFKHFIINLEKKNWHRVPSPTFTDSLRFWFRWAEYNYYNDYYYYSRAGPPKNKQTGARRSLSNPLFHPLLLVHLQKNGYHKKTEIFNFIVLNSQNDQSNINA